MKRAFHPSRRADRRHRPGGGRGAGAVQRHAHLLDVSAGQSKATGSTSRVWGVDSGNMTTSWFGASARVAGKTGRRPLGAVHAAVVRARRHWRSGPLRRRHLLGAQRLRRPGQQGLPAGHARSQQPTPFFVTTLSFNLRRFLSATRLASPHFTSGTLTSDSGWSDSVLYTSPNLGGATLHGGRRAATAATTASGPALQGAGAIDAAFSWRDVKDGATAVADTKGTGGPRPATTSAWPRPSVNTARWTTRPPATPTTSPAWASACRWATAKSSRSGARSSPDRAKAQRTFSASYDFFLSKRTDLYAVAMSDKIPANQRQRLLDRHPPSTTERARRQRHTRRRAPATPPSTPSTKRNSPSARLAALGARNMLVMYAGAIAVPLIVGRALKLAPEQVALLIQADLFCCGLVTLIQSLGMTRWFGIKLPVMMGVTFAAVRPMVAFANAMPGWRRARHLRRHHRRGRDLDDHRAGGQQAAALLPAGGHRHHHRHHRHQPDARGRAGPWAGR